ncbi:MAG: hypothetical protein CMJ32_11390 [Phycisphaerae bacterium]|nr:hypothetical protein [Phycisphaerae bacterium]
MLPSVALGDLVVEYEGVGAGSYQMMAYNNSLNWDEAGSGSYVSLEAFQHEWTSVSTGESYSTYCIQLYQGVEFGDIVDFTIVDIAQAPEGPPSPGPMGQIKSSMMQDLYARFYDEALLQDDEYSTAFQLVIYEITHENFVGSTANEFKNEMSYGTGAFQWQSASSAISSIVNNMTSSLGVGGWISDPSLVGLVNDDYQDQAYYVPGPGALSLLAITGICARNRRRR